MFTFTLNPKLSQNITSTLNKHKRSGTVLFNYLDQKLITPTDSLPKSNQKWFPFHYLLK